MRILHCLLTASLLLLLLGVDNVESRISSTPIQTAVNQEEMEEEEQTQRFAQEEESPCLSTFNVEVPGPCDVTSLTAAVTSAFNSISDSNPCPHDITKELTLLFPSGVNQAAITACSSSSSNALPFSSLSNEKNALFDKEYFDGGTKYNADTPYTDNFSCPMNILANDPSIQRIKTIHDTTVTTTPIALPEGSNFKNCDLNTIMCCFTSDRDSSEEGQEPITANTDVCYHDLRTSPGSNRVESGYVIYDGTKEEDGALCHGFTYGQSQSTSEIFAGNLLYHVSLYTHLAKEGHVRNIPGSPMCACVEQMATVEKADCTQIVSGGEEVTVLYSYDSFEGGLKAEVVEYAPVQFGSCVEGGNGLVDHYAAAIGGGSTGELVKHVVGEGQCDSAIDDFLMLTQGIQRKAAAPTTVTRL